MGENADRLIFNADIEIGCGENGFTMERGSFSYKSRLFYKRKLILVRTKETGDSKIYSYKDKATGEMYEFDLTKENGIYRFFLTKAPDNDVNRFFIRFQTSMNEHIYGCGETYSEFDLKGQNVRIWVAEHQNAKRITKKILKEKIVGSHPNSKQNFSKYESYYAQPTFVSSDCYFVHVNTDEYAEFDFRRPDLTTLLIEDTPDIYFAEADSFEELSWKLSTLLGKQKMLPDWTFDGAIMAIQQGTEIVDRKIKNALAKGVKLVGVWCQDWCGCRRTGFGYQVMWNWQADDEQYKGLKEKIAEWKEQGVRFLGYINPFIALEKNLYQEAKEKGYCVKDKEGNDYLVTITTFPAAMVDFTNPDAYDWYKKIIKENMIGIGMSGWMADFGEYLPTDAVLFSGESAEELHNRWPAIWARLNSEVIRECGVEDEVFFFTRAGHTETVKYSSMMWTGDQHVDWSVDDGMPSVIPATLSLAMSGYGLSHSDVGGYTTIMHMRRSRELLLRWEEMNAFSPLFRSHEGNQPANNVQFDDDDELLTHLKRCVDWHVALKGYLKETVKVLEERAVPVMKPLFYRYDEEEAYEETTEYLLGDDILVAPVLKDKAKRRRVYLPKDEWIHLLTGKEYEGGTFEVDAPVGCPPVFVRKQSKWAQTLPQQMRTEQ